jgi:glutathione S-transferase
VLTLFGNLESGNVHKVQLILAHLRLRYVMVDVAQTRGEPRRPEFLALNPMGKVPVVVLDGGDVLTESGAILYWFGRDTALWPGDNRAQAEVLRWMFFEQYSHEPALAVLRYERRFAVTPAPEERVRELETKAHRALAAMRARLERSEWIACDSPTLADYALYPYTRWADEAGVDLTEHPAVEHWLSRIEALPRFVPLRSHRAIRVESFETYFER